MTAPPPLSESNRTSMLRLLGGVLSQMQHDTKLDQTGRESLSELAGQLAARLAGDEFLKRILVLEARVERLESGQKLS